MDLFGVIGVDNPQRKSLNMLDNLPPPPSLHPTPEHCKQVLKLAPRLEAGSCALNLFQITFAQISG